MAFLREILRPAAVNSRDRRPRKVVELGEQADKKWEGSRESEVYILDRYARSPEWQHLCGNALRGTMHCAELLLYSLGRFLNLRPLRCLFSRLA